MSTFQDFFAPAEHARIELGKPREAILYYKEAIASRDCTFEQRVNCQHMIGACFRMIGELEMALAYYQCALSGALLPLKAGTILRDMALCYIDGKDYKEAASCLEQAFNFLPSRESVEEYSMTLSFKARLELAKGDCDRALRFFEIADANLFHGINRHYYLYNSVNFASALSKDKQRWRSRVVSCRALGTAFQLRDRKNIKRSLVLIVGGVRLENLIKYLRTKLR